MDIDKEEREILIGESEPVIVIEPVSKFWKRFGLKDKVYTIEKKPLPYGVVLQITSCLAEIEVPAIESIRDAAKYFTANEIYVTRTIGYALNCSPDKNIPDWMMLYIRKNMDAVKAMEIFYFIVDQSNIINFTTAISYATKRLVAKEKDSEVPQE